LGGWLGELSEIDSRSIDLDKRLRKNNFSAPTAGKLIFRVGNRWKRNFGIKILYFEQTLSIKDITNIKK
jgi:hypothetical protein